MIGTVQNVKNCNFQAKLYFKMAFSNCFRKD